MFIVGVGFVSIGYALAYYAFNVLKWSRGTDAKPPAPMAALLGLKSSTATQGSKPFLPLFNLEGATDGHVPFGGAVGGSGPVTSNNGPVQPGSGSQVPGTPGPKGLGNDGAGPGAPNPSSPNSAGGTLPLSFLTNGTAST